MALFGKKLSTLEDLRKAYADLSDDDKKTFRQSLDDRVDESVGEQEHLDGDADTLTAKDRIDEAEGTERADEEREEAETSDTSEAEDSHAEEETPDETSETQSAPSLDEALKPLREEIAKLSARIDLIERSPQAVDDGLAKKLNELENLYNN